MMELLQDTGCMALIVILLMSIDVYIERKH